MKNVDEQCPDVIRILSVIINQCYASCSWL